MRRLVVWGVVLGVVGILGLMAYAAEFAYYGTCWSTDPDSQRQCPSGDQGCTDTLVCDYRIIGNGEDYLVCHYYVVHQYVCANDHWKVCGRKITYYSTDGSCTGVWTDKEYKVTSCA